MKHKYTLAYDDIYLSPLTSETSENYRRLRNHPDIRQWFRYKDDISEAQQRRWFEKYIKDPCDAMFAIFSSESNEFIGANAIYNIDGNGLAEYGRIIIDPELRGRGFGYKATCAAILIARDQMNLQQLVLEVYDANQRAISIYRKCGFIETGMVCDTCGIPMKVMKIEL